jgi:prepilin-type N-terminal cleavage/methylation domain-containing protein
MKKYRHKYFYTLVELLMAMAIFAIISVIMMRFFNSAQQIWSKASQKNVLYSDARVALDMMAAELQGALYDNNTTTGIYPFWNEYKSLQDAEFTGIGYNCTTTFGGLKEADRYGKNFVPQLNFIAATTYLPNSNVKSNVCEIKYIFLPVRYDTDPVNYPTGKWIITGTADPLSGGILARACIGDRDTLNATNISNTNGLYNFLLLPNLPANTDRVDRIFNVASSGPYQKVIDGIIDMEITCYTLNGGLLKSYNPMKNGGVIATVAADGLRVDGDLVANIGGLRTGSPFPVAIKIDLYMLAERDMHEWLTALNNNNLSHANIIKSERMRCFSKTIYLSSGK